MQPSSRDLHPRTGARFVFDKLDDTPRYSVTIYLPDARSWTGELAWSEGQAQLSAGAPSSQDELDWARAETLKLARVLRRDPKQHMVRWRANNE